MCKKNASAHTPFERMCPILANDAKIFGQDDGYDDYFIGVDEITFILLSFVSLSKNKCM